ncbi:MAG: type II toxin-antitoxin system HicB family antitoxin [Pyrinomonadaceae bacterium]
MATSKSSKTRPAKHPIVVGQYVFTVLITPNEPDGFLVTCPALPGLVTEGDTLDETRRMATDAVKCYVESLIKQGRPVPEDNSFALPITVKVA